jgi:hypothetical protein
LRIVRLRSLRKPATHRVQSGYRVDIDQHGVVRHRHLDDLLGQIGEQHPAALIALQPQQIGEMLGTLQHGIAAPGFMGGDASS